MQAVYFKRIKPDVKPGILPDIYILTPKFKEIQP